MKAILVIDVPESCLSCRLTLANLCKCKDLIVRDLINGNGEYVEGTLRHISCPLKELNEETIEELRQTFLDEVIRSMK